MWYSYQTLFFILSRIKPFTSLPIRGKKRTYQLFYIINKALYLRSPLFLQFYHHVPTRVYTWAQAHVRAHTHTHTNSHMLLYSFFLATFNSQVESATSWFVPTNVIFIMTGTKCIHLCACSFIFLSNSVLNYLVIPSTKMENTRNTAHTTFSLFPVSFVLIKVTKIKYYHYCWNPNEIMDLSNSHPRLLKLLHERKMETL